jgi:hypothetical protein
MLKDLQFAMHRSEVDEILPSRTWSPGGCANTDADALGYLCGEWRSRVELDFLAADQNTTALLTVNASERNLLTVRRAHGIESEFETAGPAESLRGDGQHDSLCHGTLLDDDMAPDGEGFGDRELDDVAHFRIA